MKSRPELLVRLEALVNRSGGDEGFVKHMNEWPRTIRELIYGSQELMLRFKLVELIPNPFENGGADI